MTSQRLPAESASIQSVERALDILFLLADAKSPLTVGQIAEQLGVHNSTASRLLSTLAQQNVVVQSRDGYRLGLGLLRLTHVVLNELNIRTVANPHLRRLCQETGHVIYLATLFEGDELYLDQIDTEESASKTSWIGRTIPAHTASGGKVLLAHLNDEAIAAYLERDLISSTRQTITTPEHLLAQLSAIRERGYAISQDEYLLGFSNVAAPIFDRSRKNIAVVALSGPTTQLPLERLNELASQVVTTASAISIELGYTLNGKGKNPNESRRSSTYRLTHH